MREEWLSILGEWVIGGVMDASLEYHETKFEKKDFEKIELRV
jgi:hypothetical protein